MEEKRYSRSGGRVGERESIWTELKVVVLINGVWCGVASGYWSPPSVACSVCTSGEQCLHASEVGHDEWNMFSDDVMVKVGSTVVSSACTGGWAGWTECCASIGGL